MTEPRDPLPLSAAALRDLVLGARRYRGTLAKVTASDWRVILDAARSTDGLRSALEPGDGNASQDGPQPEAEAVFPKGRGCPQGALDTIAAALDRLPEDRP